MEFRRIESKSNPTIKSVSALGLKKERDSRKKFCFEGIHLLEEYIRSGRRPDSVIVRDGCEKGKELAENSSALNLFSVNDAVYSKLSSEKAPQGVITVSSFTDNVVFASEKSDITDFLSRAEGNIIILDSLQDCGNVGTIIRTASAFGFSVMICGDSADVFSAKTVRASMGALFFADIIVCRDKELAVSALRQTGRRVLACALRKNGYILSEFDIKDNDCFIIGNEGNGIDEKIISLCDGTVTVPMTDKVESLNASSAASVIMWEAGRNRL